LSEHQSKWPTSRQFWSAVAWELRFQSLVLLFTDSSGLRSRRQTTTEFELSAAAKLV
jgi:hypothetical protein